MQNLEEISTKELRDNLAEVLEKVAIGQQTFLVSKFGRKKAMIVPIANVVGTNRKKQKRDLRNLSAYGMWKDRREMKDSVAWVSKLRERQSFRIKN